MLKTFHCPACHAALDYDHDADDLAIRCPYCTTTVIVPEELRRRSDQAESHFEAFSDASLQTLMEVAQLARAGRKIEAIKRYREAFDVGLKEAKDIVEQMQRGGVVQIGGAGGPADRTWETDDAAVARTGGRAGCIVGTIVLVLVLGFVGAFFVITTSTTRSIAELVDEGGLPAEVREVIPQPTPTPAFADLVLSFGREGIGPGRFNDTRHLGVDAEGFIYTADYNDGRVQVFDVEGNFVTTWNAGVDIIEAMAVNRQGVVSILRVGNIHQFDGRTGERLNEIAYENFLTGLAATADGGLIAFDDSLSEDVVVHFDADGTIVQTFPNMVGNYDQEMVLMADQIVADGANNMYLLTRETILKFGPEGNFITRISSEGDAPDQLRVPQTLATDGRGRLYVSDFDGIKVFDPNGRYLAFIEFPQPSSVVFSIAITDKDELFAMDRNGNQVLKYVINE